MPVPVLLLGGPRDGDGAIVMEDPGGPVVRTIRMATPRRVTLADYGANPLTPRAPLGDEYEWRGERNALGTRLMRWRGPA